MAAKAARLKFIVNVVLNSEKEVIFAAAGDCESAHKKGTDFIQSLCSVNAVEADVVITTNGGYPLDQNIYQAVKGMTAAEATVRKGGVIIMLAASNDGIEEIIFITNWLTRRIFPKQWRFLWEETDSRPFLINGSHRF